jgi:hypothetical protein
MVGSVHGMADGERYEDGDHPTGSVHDLLGQLHSVANRLWKLAAASPAAVASLPGMPGLPGLPGLPPLPGALSAAQLDAIVKAVHAHRQQIETLKAQLAAFDQQLVVLEQMLEPLAAWSTSWAELERAVVNLRPGSSEGSAGST